MLQAIFLLASTVYALSWAVTGKPCLSYEPSIVSVRGTLIRKTFPGPPNYESIKNGDRPETYWFLELAQPVCVKEDKANTLNPGRQDIIRIQLVVKQAIYLSKKNLVGKPVVATGTLLGEHTGQHHTPVLLTIKTLERAD